MLIGLSGLVSMWEIQNNFYSKMRPVIYIHFVKLTASIMNNL